VNADFFASLTQPGVFYSPIVSGPPNALAQDSIFERIAGHGTTPAISSDGRVFTYADLLSVVVALRGELKARFGLADSVAASVAEEGGEQPKLAVLAEPSFEYVVATLAVWSLGCVAVPLHPAHPLPEMQYIAENAQVVGIVSTASLAERAAELAPALSPCSQAAATAPADAAARVYVMPEYAPGPGAEAAVAECARQLKSGSCTSDTTMKSYC